MDPGSDRGQRSAARQDLLRVSISRVPSFADRVGVELARYRGYVFPLSAALMVMATLKVATKPNISARVIGMTQLTLRRSGSVKGLSGPGSRCAVHGVGSPSPRFVRH